MYEDIYFNLCIWAPYTANQRLRMLQLKVILGGLQCELPTKCRISFYILLGC